MIMGSETGVRESSPLLSESWIGIKAIEGCLTGGVVARVAMKERRERTEVNVIH